MPHSQSFDALVLKTYDVGEADRLCILFTRENGRMMARASGVRRPKSRMGGSLLPFTRLTVELKEGAGGWFVSGASEVRRGDLSSGTQAERSRGVKLHAPTSDAIQFLTPTSDAMQSSAVTQFTALQEGIELLLRLVTDEGALPEVFELTSAFIDACHQGQAHAVLGYSFALLHQLGLLPVEEEMEQLESLMPAEHGYLRACMSGRFTGMDPACNISRLIKLKNLLLQQQLQTPLKAPDISEQLC